MKIKVISLITAMCLLSNVQAEAKGFWKKVGKFLGNVAEAAVVVGVDHLYDTYAPEAKAQYQQTMQRLNEESTQRDAENKAAWDTYKQGRQEELRKELSRTSDYAAREMIRQEMAELDGISSSSANYNETSITRSIAAEVGINQQNIKRGMAWNSAQNKYEQKIDGYPFDETVLSQSQKSELNAIADILNRYSDIKVLIVGHTCEIGYKIINQRKGLKRAEAGKEYLIEKGIASERISVDSKGETQPLVQNKSSENRKKNRRIVFVIE